MVEVSISSAIPFAHLPMTSADAGAISTISAFFARAMWWICGGSLRSKGLVRHRLPVSASKGTGGMMFLAFSVSRTWTSAPFCTSILTRFGIL